MRKLKLKRDTIAVLDSRELRRALGGVIDTWTNQEPSATCYYCTIPWPPPLRAP